MSNEENIITIISILENADSISDKLETAIALIKPCLDTIRLAIGEVGLETYLQDAAIIESTNNNYIVRNTSTNFTFKNTFAAAREIADKIPNCYIETFDKNGILLGTYRKTPENLWNFEKFEKASNIVYLQNFFEQKVFKDSTGKEWKIDYKI